MKKLGMVFQGNTERYYGAELVSYLLTQKHYRELYEQPE